MLTDEQRAAIAEKKLQAQKLFDQKQAERAKIAENKLRAERRFEQKQAEKRLSAVSDVPDNKKQKVSVVAPASRSGLNQPSASKSSDQGHCMYVNVPMSKVITAGPRNDQQVPTPKPPTSITRPSLNQISPNSSAHPLKGYRPKVTISFEVYSPTEIKVS
jgi:hypothetical protein